MNNRTNLPLSAHTEKVWFTTETPDFRQVSARHALNVMFQCGIQESLIALRDEVFTIVVPHLGLLYDMFVMNTKDGKKSYSLSDLQPDSRPHTVLFRVLNGELYTFTEMPGEEQGDVKVEERLDTYAWTDEEYDKNLPAKKRQVIGVNSEAGRANLQAAIDSLKNPRDKARLEALFKMYAVDFVCGVQTASWRQVVEVTQEMIDAGLTHISNDYDKPTDEPTQLLVGDFLVITDDGMYRIDRKTFEKTHLTFTQYK